MAVRRVCPQCRYHSATGILDLNVTPPSLTQMVCCLRCRYVCHHTHWKTPEEHAKREAQTQAFIEAIERGESPESAIRRIYPDSEPEKGPS